MSSITEILDWDATKKISDILISIVPCDILHIVSIVYNTLKRHSTCRNGENLFVILRDIKSQLEGVQNVDNVFTNETFFKIMASLVSSDVNMWDHTASSVGYDLQQQQQDVNYDTPLSELLKEQPQPQQNSRTPKKTETKSIDRVSERLTGGQVKKTTKSLVKTIKTPISQVPEYLYKQPNKPSHSTDDILPFDLANLADCELFNPIN